MIDMDQKVRADWTADLASFLLRHGVQGLYPCGTTGEMLYLTIEERKLIAKTLVETRDKVKPDVPVYIQTGAARVEETIELTIHAKEIGADGAGIVTPWYYRIDDAALFAFYELVFSQIPSDFPLYVYNIPQLSGNDLKPETIAGLKRKFANLVGIKYSFSDFNRLKEYIALEGIEVLVGADVQMVESMLLGAKGTVSGLSSVYPEIFVEIYRLFREQKYEEAIALESYAYDLGCIMHHGGNLSMFKAGLEHRGFQGGLVRPPLRNLDAVEKIQFVRDLEDWEKHLSNSYPLMGRDGIRKNTTKAKEVV